jgi:hypothetical protein
MRGVAAALGAGLALLLVAIVLVLLHAPMSVALKNGVVQREKSIATTEHGANYCQGRELLPAGTSAIRVWLSAYTGPRVRLLVSSDGQPIASGEKGSGWTGREVTVPVKPLPHAVADVTVCLAFQLRDESVGLFGALTSPSVAAHNGDEALKGRMWIEYLRPGKSSWAALIPTVARNMGLGRAYGGIGIVLLALALLLTVATLATVLVLKEVR